MSTDIVSKKSIDTTLLGSTVLTKLKGVYLSLENIHKLSNIKQKYNNKVSESRIVNKALDEFFEKYE